MAMEGGLISLVTHHHFQSPRFLFSGAGLSPTAGGSSSLRKRRLFSSTVTNRSSESEIKEIRVCTHRTCRKQGSLQTLEILTGISPGTVTVKTCGCLGRCGSGPNLALLPEGLIVSHCGTAARAARIICQSEDDVQRSLEALALRKRAEIELDRRNYSDAELLLTQAINLKPVGGIHIMYRDRSIARLSMDNYDAALNDANEAIALAPRFVEAYLCEGDVFMAMERYDEAEKSYSICLEIDPSIRRSKSFKGRVQQLREKLVAADTP